MVNPRLPETSKRKGGEKGKGALPKNWVGVCGPLTRPLPTGTAIQKFQQIVTENRRNVGEKVAQRRTKRISRCDCDENHTSSRKTELSKLCKLLAQFYDSMKLLYSIRRVHCNQQLIISARAVDKHLP